jgi:hypothetical protein
MIPTWVYPMPESPAAEAETPEISVVVPLFNEQENVGELHRRLTLALQSAAVPYEILFVDDGSRDELPRSSTSSTGATGGSPSSTSAATSDTSPPSPRASTSAAGAPS